MTLSAVSPEIELPDAKVRVCIFEPFLSRSRVPPVDETTPETVVPCKFRVPAV